MKTRFQVSGFRFQVSGLGFLALAFLALGAFAADEEVGAKNLYDVPVESLPGDLAKLLEGGEIEKWSYNFRPYGGGAADLVTDPGVVRDLVLGGESEKKVTGFRASADLDGFTVLVYCGEPSVQKTISATNTPPLPGLEIYVTPSDADNTDPEVYWQFFLGNNWFREFEWPAQNRHWRPYLPALTQRTQRIPSGYVFSLRLPWDVAFDNLPFNTGRAEQIWRVGVMRWVEGGVTWGGVVHEPSQSGYIRFRYTEADQTEVMARILERAWADFCKVSGAAPYAVARPTDSKWSRKAGVMDFPYVRDRLAKEGERTYINYGEDPDFAPTLIALEDAARALAPKIAVFREMKTMEEKRTFYKLASDKLFNYAHDVRAAYAAQLKKGMFK